MVIAILLSGGSAHGQSDTDFVRSITVGERAMLPEWCLDAQSFGYGDAYSNTSPRAAHWIGLMGKTFWAAHHYCWALIKAQRARATASPGARVAWLKSTISDINYVINFATPDFVLLPEVLTRLGEAYVSLEDYAAANEAFAKARGIKPDYWPPYVRWAEVLVRIGKKGEALELVEQVVKLNADDPEVKRQYDLIKAMPAKGAQGSRQQAAPKKTQLAPEKQPSASGRQAASPSTPSSQSR